MSRLKSRDSRLRLYRQGKAQEIKWESVGTGRAIGDRRLAKSPAGKFYTRLFDKNRPGKKYHTRSLGSADDVAPANGTDILRFAQAVKLVSDFDPWANPDTGDKVATVADACNLYLEWAESNRPDSYRSIESCLRVHVLGDEVESIPVKRLTIRHLERWKARVAAKPRGHSNGPLAPPANDAELQSRKESTKQSIAYLKRSLRYCKDIGAITCDDTAWQSLKPFKGSSRSGRRGHPDYLKQEQVAALFEAIPDRCFLALVQAAIYCGARYTELANMRVGDWDQGNGSITVQSGKGRKKRYIFVGDEGSHLFSSICSGRPDDERIFLKSNGTMWGTNHQQKLLARARKAAGIKKHFSFHLLRHTYGSHYMLSGGDIFFLQKQLGHSSIETTSRYAHLAKQSRQDQAKACEPSFAGATTSPTATEATLH